MTRILVIGAILFCFLTTTAVAANNPRLSVSGATPVFTSEMVSGKTMVSSGYSKGTVTFNLGGSLTCTDYPTFITCKTWEITSDGTILRIFNDTRDGVTTEIKAWWKLQQNNGTSYAVIQTSSNSAGETSLTITCK